MTTQRITSGGRVGQVDTTVVPRFDVDVAVLGVPFDAGVSDRPGARFGPAHVRESSRLLRPYDPAQGVRPFAAQQVVDAGDLGVNPFDVEVARPAAEAAAGCSPSCGASRVPTSAPTSSRSPRSTTPPRSPASRQRTPPTSCCQ